MAIFAKGELYFFPFIYILLSLWEKVKPAQQSPWQDFFHTKWKQYEWNGQKDENHSHPHFTLVFCQLLAKVFSEMSSSFQVFCQQFIEDKRKKKESVRVMVFLCVIKRDLSTLHSNIFRKEDSRMKSSLLAQLVIEHMCNCNGNALLWIFLNILSSGYHSNIHVFLDFSLAGQDSYRLLITSLGWHLVIQYKI